MQSAYQNAERLEITLRISGFVLSVCAVSEGTEKILSISENGFGKQTFVSSYRLTKRGGKGNQY